jgi:hypothetical protein
MNDNKPSYERAQARKEVAEELRKAHRVAQDREGFEVQLYFGACLIAAGSPAVDPKWAVSRAGLVMAEAKLVSEAKFPDVKAPWDGGDAA